jgi:two-component system response regulator AtoC
MSYTILIIDDEEHARQNISEYLKTSGYEVFEAGTLKEGREHIANGDGDVIILDVQLPDGYGLDFLNEITTLPQKPPVILITGYGDIEMAVDAMKNGAHDFLTKPIMDLANLEASISRATEIVQMRRELNHIHQNQIKNNDFVIGNSQDFKVLLDQAEKAAAASVSVLITGETGTGKEVLARFIHRSGPRSDKPFIAINCAAIQPTVLESELFGYEKGAFTDAIQRKHGLMEVADSGILFLDEISSMPTDIQAKLLRAIEERAFRRVGGTSEINVDVQVLAASNRNIQDMIKDGKFREDLYYRLKVVDLHLPPLRERKKDIPELVGFFVNKFNLQMGKNVIDITPEALKALVEYKWPGNIRELSNIVQRAMLFCDGEKITMSDLPLDIAKGTNKEK